MPKRRSRRPAKDRLKPAGSVAPRLTLVGAEVGAEDVRWNRVLTAKARVAFNYYERQDVLERLAEAVLKEIRSR